MVEACRVLKVDLTSGKAREEILSGEHVGRFLGGRALGAMLLYNELRPNVDPLGPENKLIFSVGPLTGTVAQGSSRYCVNTKSPLTNLYLDSLSGGYFGPELKKTGFTSVVIEGKSPDPVYLLIRDNEVEIRDASTIWGMTVGHTQEFIKEDLRDQGVRIACIGPAGENLVPYASILNERRAAGRGGAGAVMGAKNLKAIAVKGSGRVEVADRRAFNEAARLAGQAIKSNPVTGRAYPQYGTGADIGFFNEMGFMPFRNWQEACSQDARHLLAEVMRERYVIKSTHCAPPCAVNSSKYCLVRQGPHAGALSEGPEYETIYSFGSCCGITDLAAIIEADQLCDSYGLDTVSMGVSLAFAMECYEKGIINDDSTGGLELRFGNAEVLHELIRDTAYRRGFGEILALGSQRMAERFGRGSEAFAMHAKGMELGGYDPRAGKSLALVYAAGPRGGCHHAAGYTPFMEIALGNGRFSIEGKATIAKQAREMTVVKDSAIMCVFVGVAISDELMSQLLSAATGFELKAEELYLIGERGSNVERAFNVREGLRRSWDTLPRRLLTEPLSSGSTAGQVVDFEPLLTEFYQVCGWDLQTGIPTQERLQSLGLDVIARDMRELTSAVS